MVREKRHETLNGETALVTGASRGIGRAIAEKLERLGARVATIQRGDGPGISLSTDLSSSEAAETAVADAIRRLGRLDICVHSAGITARVPMLELSVDAWRRVIEVNLTSAFVITRAAARQYVDQGSCGRIVYISSMLATFGGVGVGAYSASKGGVVQLMKSQSNEWAPHGIRVNAVAPGWIDTDFTEPLRTDPDRDRDISGRIPLGRWGSPDDIAEAVAWLVGPGATYVTGTVIAVDGGYASR